MKKLLPGLTPIWLTEDLAEVSTQVFDENGTYGDEQNGTCGGELFT